MPESYPHGQIPGPIFDGNSQDQIDPVLRTQMDQGNVKSRLRFTRTPTRWRVRFRFVTELEYQIFEAWHRYRINLGADSFEMDITVSTGKSVTHTVQFTRMYRMTQLTGEAREVTADLLIHDRETQSEAWLNSQIPP